LDLRLTHSELIATGVYTSSLKSRRFFQVPQTANKPQHPAITAGYRELASKTNL